MRWRRVHSFSAAGLLGLQAVLSGAALAQPQPAAFAHPSFQRVWERTDRPVANGTVKRTWFWGPQANTGALTEPNKESPGGSRTVQYFDKSRMEINNPRASPNDQFFVTNGLLTVELVSGVMQTGASTYQGRSPACIAVTGDPGDQNAPTYAAMQRVSNTTLGDHFAASAVGQAVTATYNSRGEVGADASKANVAEAKIAYFDDVTRHNIPGVFWTFLNQSGPVFVDSRAQNAQLNSPWFYASGRPISEAYWTRATISGKNTEVLVQLYERRALTYVATNPEGFKVEMANIGQHYYDWRYKEAGRCGDLVSGEITFQAFGDPAEIDVFKSVIASYNQFNPDVKVNLVAIAAQGDHLSRLATSFAAGNPPEVFLINYRRYGQFASQGVLEPLGQYLADSITLKASDYYTESLSAFTYNGTLQCIPQNISSLSVYYNKDLFTRYNVPLPTARWTWDDFLAAARALTKDTDGNGSNDIYGMGVDTQLIRLAPFIWSNGGELVDNYDKPTRLLLDTAEAQEAFQWFVDLQVKHHVAPTKAEITSRPGPDRFLDGTLGMWFGSRADTPTFRTIKNFTWDVAPIPIKKTAATILHSDGYCMASGVSAEMKAAAWDFIQFAQGVRGQTVAARLGRTVPSLKSVANSPAFLDPTQPPANSKIYLDAIPTIRRVPITPVWGAVETAVNAEIDRAFYGQATLQQATAAAIEKANAEFAKVK
jgi:multiple sugar transport system substrate-binding protein